MRLDHSHHVSQITQMKTTTTCQRDELEQALERFKEQTAFIVDQTQISFNQFKKMAEHRAEQLHEMGLSSANSIASLESDPLHITILFFACGLLQIPFIPLNPKSPKHLLDEHLSLFDVELVRQEDLEGPPPSYRSTGELTKTSWSWSFGTDETAVILMTSGSTGKPKAAMLTWGNLIYSAKGTNDFYQLNIGDRWTLSLPMFHIAGLIIPIRTLIAGGMTVISQQMQESEYHSFVPTQLIRTLQDPEKVRLLRSSKAILVGGAATSPETIRKAIELGLKVSVTYGSTESTSSISAHKPGDIPSSSDDIGAILPYRQVTIKEGVISFRGATRFAGYLTKTGPDKPFDQEGYFVSRDIGSITENKLRLYGRKDDLVIFGGENISPQWVESKLQPWLSGGVLHLVGIKDLEYGQRPVLVIWSDNESDLVRIKTVAKKTLQGPWLPKEFYWFSLSQHVGLKLNRSHSREVVEALVQKNKSIMAQIHQTHAATKDEPNHD